MKTTFALLLSSVAALSAFGCGDSEGTTPNCPGFPSDPNVCNTPYPEADSGATDSATDDASQDDASDAATQDASTQDASDAAASDAAQKDAGNAG